MFDDEIQEAIATFDDFIDYEFINPEDLLEEAKEKNQSLYKDLKSSYDLFKYHQQQNEIFPDSEYLNNIKSDIVTLYKKYKNYTPIINSFMGFLCLHDKDYKNAQTYFLKDNNYLDAFFVCMKRYQESDSQEDKNIAFSIAKKELEFECREKGILYIDYAIFKFVIDYCIELDDFSIIVTLIDIMYSMPFKKNQKFEDFYYSLIKIASVKSINLRFLQSKDFFSKENFQTICIQIKDLLSSNNYIENNVTPSFDKCIAKADELKKQNDFQGAETFYREAINISYTSKQRQIAFKGIYNLYKNTDQVKMLSIINEFFEKDVFESEFFKYYSKSKMLIYTKSDNVEISENLNLLCNVLSTLDRKPWRWNEPIIKCMELIKFHVQNLLKSQTFNEAHSMCKMGLGLSSYIQKNDAITENHMKFFSLVQTQCGKVKKDLAKKGTAKITEPNIKIEAKRLNQEVVYDDLDNMPMFKFNPSGLLQYINISTEEQYEQYYSNYNNTTKKFNQDVISKKIFKLVNSIEISNLIKSIYIKDNTFMGNPKQARSDIDFYLNSNIRTNATRKRDEYLSFCKIIKDVIESYGEIVEYKITEKVKKEYVMNAMIYHSRCVKSEESRRYYLNVAQLIRKDLEDYSNKQFLTVD